MSLTSPSDQSDLIKASLKGIKAPETSNVKIHPKGQLVKELANPGAETSLLCKLTHNNQFRRVLVKVSENSWFNGLIILCIMISSLTMGLNDYESEARCKVELAVGECPYEKQSQWNKVLNWIGTGMGVIFIFEAAIKITALGFAFGHQTYMKSPWNTIDFVIVVATLVELISYSFKFQINLKILRTLRVLRPLKAMKQVPSLKRQISSLLRSIIGLVNAAVFLGFIFLIFSIVGL